MHTGSGEEHTDYSITKAEIFKKGTDTAIATSSIENKVMKLTMGDYKVEAEITGENFSADGGALFQISWNRFARLGRHCSEQNVRNDDIKSEMLSCLKP